jgi:hypothetical protein
MDAVHLIRFWSLQPGLLLVSYLEEHFFESIGMIFHSASQLGVVINFRIHLIS